MAEDGGHGDAGFALLEVEVAAADAGGTDLDEHLAALGGVKLDGFERVGLLDLADDGCASFTTPLMPSVLSGTAATLEHSETRRCFRCPSQKSS